MFINDALHILRNPYGHSAEAIKEAQLRICDAYEEESRAHQANRKLAEQHGIDTTVYCAASAAPSSSADQIEREAIAAFDDRHFGYEFPSDGARDAALNEFVAGWFAHSRNAPASKEHADLAANQCVHPKGIVGNEGGTPCCPLATGAALSRESSAAMGELPPLTITPNTLGGFKGAFCVEYRRNPTEQEIFDAGVRSGLGRAAAQPNALIPEEVKPFKSLAATVADALRPFCGEGQKVIWREPYRWHDDQGVLSNHYEMYSPATLAETFNYALVVDCECAAVIAAAPMLNTQEKKPCES